MITAYQSATLRGAKQIEVSADGLREILTLICFSQEERKRLMQAIELLHKVFAELIPNEDKEGR